MTWGSTDSIVAAEGGIDMKRRRKVTIHGLNLNPLWWGGYSARIAGRLVLFLMVREAYWTSVVLMPLPRRVVLATTLRGCVLDTRNRIIALKEVGP